jgi:hypothetical protein
MVRVRCQANWVSHPVLEPLDGHFGSGDALDHPALTRGQEGAEFLRSEIAFEGCLCHDGAAILKEEARHPKEQRESRWGNG